MCAVDRDEVARVLFETDYDPSIPEWGEWGVYPPDDQAEYLALADALLSSGVLVDAVDVRARAQQEIYDRAAYWSDKFGKEVPVGCIYLDTTPPTEDDIAWAQEVAERLGLTDRDAR